MVVGCKDVDFKELKQACVSPEALLQYTLNIIPTPLRHIEAIVSNQKYFIALQVREIQSFPWRKKKDLCESLLRGVQVKGVPDVLYDYWDILRAIDCTAFSKYLEEDARKNAEG